MNDKRHEHRVWTLLLVGAVAFALSACSTGPVVQAEMLTDSASGANLDETIDFQRVDFDRLERAIFEATNTVRREHARSELQRSRLLARASRKYARRMVDKGFLSHHDPTSERLRTPEDRVRAAGAANPRPAENIADVPGFRVKSGQPYYVLDADEPVIALDPDGPPIARHTYASYAATVVNGWMKSPGHRRNLLDPNAVQVGHGAAMYYQNEVPSFLIVQKFQLYERLR